jgi:hypothetical protein
MKDYSLALVSVQRYPVLKEFFHSDIFRKLALIGRALIYLTAELSIGHVKEG